MKLWVDDERLPPKGWKQVTTGENALILLQSDRVTITHLSLDHDLGPGMSGYDLVKRMVASDIFPDNIYVHTMNPVGAHSMLAVLNRYAPETCNIMRTIPAPKASEVKRCALCGDELTPVFPDSNYEETEQFDGALVVDFLGGYGMYFDPLSNTGRKRTVMCQQCADEFIAKNPWVKPVIEDMSDWGTEEPG